METKLHLICTVLQLKSKILILEAKVYLTVYDKTVFVKIISKH